MCGICGEVRFDGGRVSSHVIAAMRDQLLHRGPDAFGIYVSPGESAGLGFRRLRIIDLSEAANQPLGNEDGSVQVVFNGEIYNFKTLRDDLVKKGHTFRSRSDTEVIVHLYEEHGDACFEKLEGMFAIGIWDNRNQRLVLARDRAGKKPLFYLKTNSNLMFASEVKAFFGRADVDLRIDPEAIPSYFLHGYVPGPATFYRSVRQVEPGTVMTVERSGAAATRTYWSLQFPPARALEAQPPNHTDAVATVRRLMSDAVERRLTSDVPLGAFLSGGLDSTIVVGLMSRLLDRPVKTFSIGFKDCPDYDETGHARVAAERFKTDHTEFIVEPAAFDLIERLVWHHDGPFGDSSAVPTYIVSQLTRRHVTVVLTGDGGDEVFAGYLRFYAAQAGGAVPASVRSMLRLVARAVGAGESARHWTARVNRFATSASLPLEERLTHLTSQFYDDVDQMLASDFRRSVGAIDRLSYLSSFRDRMSDLSPLSKLLLINFNTYLRDDLLVKTDRCTMANAVEARAPFLDTALVEYVAGLPDEMKLARGRTKIVLREAFQDLVPPSIQRRGKMGFGVPFGLWFRGALREAVDEMLLSGNALYQEYLSTEYVRSLVARHHAGEGDFGLQLWAILCFEVWLRALPRWTNQPAAAAARS